MTFPFSSFVSSNRAAETVIGALIANEITNEFKNARIGFPCLLIELLSINSGNRHFFDTRYPRKQKPLKFSRKIRGLSVSIWWSRGNLKYVHNLLF